MESWMPFFVVVTVAACGISGLQYMYRGLVLLSSREPELFS